MELTAATILERVTEYDIYRFYCPDFKNLDDVFSSPMPNRTDSTPSFRITERDGKLMHLDFGDSAYRGGCFDFVKQRFSIDYDSCLRKIDKEMGLGINSEEKDYKKITSSYKQPVLKEEKKEKIIRCKTRKFTKEEGRYWNEYHLSCRDLKLPDVEVHSLHKLWVDGKVIPLKNTELVFGYFFPLIGKWKIYRPFPEEGQLKFVSNVPFTTMYGMDNLLPWSTNVITKAVKDMFFLHKNVFEWVAGVQGENFTAIPPEVIYMLSQRSIDVYINFDGDAPGKKESMYYTETYGYKHINTPDHYVQEGLKDFAALGRAKGPQVVIDHFKLKGLIK